MQHSIDPVMEVATRIVRYLDEHPEASDGLPGIRDFWLGGFPPPRTTQVLDDALERLVNDRVLARVTLPGGASIYRLMRAT